MIMQSILIQSSNPFKWEKMFQGVLALFRAKPRWYFETIRFYFCEKEFLEIEEVIKCNDQIPNYR